MSLIILSLLADEEAKKAATGDVHLPSDVPRELKRRLPANSAAIKAAMKTTTRQAWIKHLDETERTAKLRKLDNNIPQSKMLKIFEAKTRRETSILTQLRTGHVALNSFLYRINAKDSPLCETCQVPETTKHYLLECERFIDQRHILRQEIKRPLNSVSALLTLAEPKRISAVLHYIQATERFPAYSELEPQTR